MATVYKHYYYKLVEELITCHVLGMCTVIDCWQKSSEEVKVELQSEVRSSSDKAS